jgi:hypothetical protein
MILIGKFSVIKWLSSKMMTILTSNSAKFRIKKQLIYWLKMKINFNSNTYFKIIGNKSRTRKKTWKYHIDRNDISGSPTDVSLSDLNVLNFGRFYVKRSKYSLNIYRKNVIN